MMTLSGQADIRQKLDRLSTVMQGRVLEKIGERVVFNSRRRIDEQTDLSGAPFTPRSAGSSPALRNKKLLLGLKSRLQVLKADGGRLEVGFSDAKTARIAAEQQQGAVRTNSFTPGSGLRPATEAQAARLIMLGFKINGRKPTVSDITGKFYERQAGAIIGKLRQEQGLPRRQNILPDRSFLGVTAQDLEEIKQIVFNELNNITGG